MYVPTHFEESRVEVLHGLMHEHPLATLVTLSSAGLNANHIPLQLSPAEGQFGILHGHVARANPLWHDLVPEVEALAIFQGPHAYITPSWYPTKQEHGKAVPTWNYVVVHAYATLRIIDDPAWLKAQLRLLTAQHESAFSQAWALDDAPSEYIERLLGAIVGIELVITTLSGKWKVSQNQPEPNQTGVVRGLQDQGTSASLDLAALIEARTN